MANKSETKKDKFVRIAEARTNKILSMLQTLGNLSNRINYEYTDEQIEAVFKAIEDEVQATKERFQAPAAKAQKFTLK